MKSTGLGQRSEISQVMTALKELDPQFDIHRWLRYCQTEVIPVILDAQLQRDHDILGDWCSERVGSVSIMGSFIQVKVI